MRPLWILAVNGFREARRNRVTVVVFGFAFAMLLLSNVALELTVTTFDRVLTDFGLGIMGLILPVLAIFLGSGLIPREIERRTVFLVLSKPISRSTFLVARFGANALTLLFVTGCMSVLLLAQFVFQRLTIGPHLFAAFVGLALESVVLSAVCFLFASFSSQFITATCTTGLYFLGHLTPDLYKMATRSESPALASAGKALYYLLPNLDRLDFKARATYAEMTTLGELSSAVLYSAGFSMALLAVACYIFDRRDFS